MSILKTADNKELIITCNCGCGDTIHVQLSGELNEENTPPEEWIYGFLSYMNMNWYRDQGGSKREKLKKLWRIARNKDYHYSEILMTPEDWKVFKEWVNEQDVPE